MPATKIASNKNTRLDLAPKAAVADVLKPLLSELANASVKNVSEAVKWDGYDFGVESSEQDEDRALTDSATAATRGYENFGGTVSFFTPLPTDTSSVYRQARVLAATPKVELVNIQRDGYAASTPFAAGQVISTFHTITDARSEQRGDKNRYWQANFKNKGYCGINRIIPSAVATAVAITGGTTVAAGSSIQLKASYEGNDITVGAIWVSSDETKAVVTKHGLVIGVAAGTANITATYPGSAAGTAKAITVS